MSTVYQIRGKDVMHDKLKSLSVGARVCAIHDSYLSLNVSCESDSNMMFPTHNGGRVSNLKTGVC